MTPGPSLRESDGQVTHVSYPQVPVFARTPGKNSESSKTLPKNISFKDTFSLFAVYIGFPLPALWLEDYNTLVNALCVSVPSSCSEEPWRSWLYPSLWCQVMWQSPPHGSAISATAPVLPSPSEFILQPQCASAVFKLQLWARFCAAQTLRLRILVVLAHGV